ncbi:MAG: YjgB family protein [Methylacidiphilales bacterium]|nr:YjgB family protein [Candidatus Methylacidiphilales bacterium]
MKIYLCLSLSLLLAGCGVFTSTALTQTNLDKIHDDMSPAEVKSVLGDPASSESEPIPIVGGTQTIYTYHSSSSEVTILFKNDLVKEKHGTFSQ